MKNKKTAFFLLKNLFVFVLLTNSALIAQNSEIQDKAVKKILEKSYPAAVKLWGIDSLSSKQNSPQFSGVVVKPEGIILTAAHAIHPGNFYRVHFPDGKTVSAKALGRMGIKSMQGRPDVGMLKIMDPGTYPFAEMGWSDSMSTNNLCVSIAYPTTLNQDVPTIRVGKIATVLDPWGFMVSTCKMEPGDSGGPLFDNLGRVIAIHSRIAIDEDINYESPVNLFREYWEDLLQPVNYAELPSTKHQFAPDTSKDKLINYLNVTPSNLVTKGIIEIVSKGDNTKIIAFGTLIKPEDKSGKFTCIVTKNSLLTNAVVVKIDGKLYDAKVVATSLSNDLALLKINKINKEAISKTKVTDSFKNLGIPLVSSLSDNKNELSSLGSDVFKFETKPAKGYFGAGANFIKGNITITSFGPDSPAAKAGLQVQDQVKFINGIAVTKPEDYGRELMQYLVGDTISIKGLRNGEEFDYNVVLEKSPLSDHPSNKFEGGRSERFDNFESVFAHDAKLKPHQCGGPVFKADGTFIGINIARFSRTCSLAIPADVIFNFVESSLNKEI
ncbi:trypsin-like peptidase domain-containing protein [Flavobacterium pectinovorum]|uniref:trypsin-like peptidase domain-containing protein n=1 Tax=Flavobacterium pectinovorum TaxID=29533 RepID=UPI001FABC5FE|nr:trypsin-like peptidase domain-containing protein [Flavobacterium pectinovorum]MCI9846008.1 trypsin-like peptidase domain-containing protein [Flavobacterium pectinovorum]